MNWRDVPTFAQGADRCEPTLASLWPPGQQKTPPETEGSRENTGEIARLPLVMIMLVEYTGTSFGIPVPTNGRVRPKVYLASFWFFILSVSWC